MRNSESNASPTKTHNHLLHSAYSVLSVVKKNLNHGSHRIHGFLEMKKPKPYFPLHSVYSVLSVVKKNLSHELQRMHGGWEMRGKTLIEKLNEGLVA